MDLVWSVGLEKLLSLEVVVVASDDLIFIEVATAVGPYAGAVRRFDSIADAEALGAQFIGLVAPAETLVKEESAVRRLIEGGHCVIALGSSGSYEERLSVAGLGIDSFMKMPVYGRGVIESVQHAYNQRYMGPYRTMVITSSDQPERLLPELVERNDLFTINFAEPQDWPEKIYSGRPEVVIVDAGIAGAAIDIARSVAQVAVGPQAAVMVKRMSDKRPYVIQVVGGRLMTRSELMTSDLVSTVARMAWMLRGQRSLVAVDGYSVFRFAEQRSVEVRDMAMASREHGLPLMVACYCVAGWNSKHSTEMWGQEPFVVIRDEVAASGKPGCKIIPVARDMGIMLTLMENDDGVEDWLEQTLGNGGRKTGIRFVGGYSFFDGSEPVAEAIQSARRAMVVAEVKGVRVLKG